MVVYRKNWFFLFVAMAIFCFSANSAVAGDEIVAKVGAIPITIYELQREFQKVLPMEGSYHKGVSQERFAEIREKALSALIEQAYKVQYALGEEIAVENGAVEDRLGSLRAKFKSIKEFNNALGNEGLSAFRASIYRELLAKKAEELAVDAKVQVTDAQVRGYFEKNKTSYKRPKQFKASHVLIRVDPASNKEEREGLLKRAEELAKRAQGGEDFYNLAYYNSDDRSKYVGGDLGYFHQGQTVEEFEQALLKMKAGEISGPVKTMYGYHIIKLVEVNESRQLEFDEVKDSIRQSLEKKQRESVYEKWITELKKRYPVQRFDN